MKILWIFLRDFRIMKGPLKHRWKLASQEDNDPVQVAMVEQRARNPFIPRKRFKEEYTIGYRLATSRKSVFDRMSEKLKVIRKRG